MAGDLDIVGTAAVDVVPIAPQFHNRLKAIVLPSADRVGEEAGRRIGEALSRHITAAIPDAITSGGRTARVAATRQGDDNAGSFARSFKRRLEVAFRSLPRPDVRLSTTGFDADLARVRARMEQLANKRVGVEIDAATAVAELDEIDAQLAELGSRSPNIQIRADIATARAEIEEMQRAINSLDGDDVHVKVHADTANAKRELIQLGALLLGVAAIPVIPVAAAGIGAITSAVVAAGAGVGALAAAAIPAIKGVTAAIQAKSAAEKESASATDRSAGAGVKAAQSALQMASAQASLSSAHRNSAQQISAANRAVQDAERSLSDAKRSARQAETDLTQARKDATQQLKDLNDSLLDGMLDEREATLRVKEARADLAATIADPKATALERERARLSLDEALRSADKQKAKNRELKRTVADANKAGVEGSKAVQDATDRVADAQRKVADQSRAVALAQAKVRDAQVQGAEAIAAAERGLQSARLSGVDTTVKSASATDAYRKALAKLTPEQRDLYDALAGPTGLKQAFAGWSKDLQPDVLPLFTRAVDGAKRALPGLTPLVRETASGVKELQDAASQELRSPFWRGFKRDIEGSAKPAVVGLGKAFGNVLKGMAGIVDAFLPHMDSIADRMVKVTGRFANWGTKLKGSPAFEKLLAYSAEHGPKLAALLGAVVDALLDIGTALSPISGPLLDFFTRMARGIANLAERAPHLVQGIWAIIVATKILNLVMGANPITLVIVAIIGLAAAVVYAYDRFTWFRNGVDGFIGALKVAGDVAVQLWKDYILPAFQGIWLVARVFLAVLVTAIIAPIWIALQGLGVVALWLWRDGFQPSLQGIATLATWLWSKILSPIFRFIWEGLKYVGSGFVWLYDHAIKPSFDWIGSKTSWLNDKVMAPAFSKLKSGVALVASAFESAKDGIAKAWGGLIDITKKPVNFVIEWVYTKGIKAVWDKVADFVGLGKLPAAPKLLAEGGRTSGGTPGVDSIPALLMADEFVVKRSSARKIGFENLAYMNATGEIPRFKDGGIVGALGGAWDWTKDKVGGAVSKGVDWAKTAADLASNPSKIWDRLMKPIIKNFTEKLGVADMGKALAKLPFKMIGGLKDKIIDAVSFTGGGGGGSANIGGTIPTGQRRAIISQALAAAGVPPPGTIPQWLAGMNTLITRESGWNPSAINLWDSNAAAGHPSQGLTQTIPGTWSAYVPSALRGRGILDPVGNVAASIRYIVSRYGNITNVQQANGNRPPQGYAAGGRVEPMWFDNGGLLPQGLSLIANGTGGPEPVFTGQQFADIRAASQRRGLDADGINVYVSTTLDGQELTGHVDKRIEMYDQQSATALTYGRNV
ncbi:transglycosylase SLT domain-containing protein [Streptomyces hilarionis]|uniref:transglycosylase SLT domain-containing protein n=1 Tax=Streptomyces hilarionis TaxID=2839954 RepID=UPI00211A057B|nr:transglycosylase SLT domain-containing protein [Streptomyces hilarionis]MCQ9134136.1 transglycosylase SLT domain-containing protein [Streptomyces hilarionis]